jgi:hypothetical protein
MMPYTERKVFRLIPLVLLIGAAPIAIFDSFLSTRFVFKSRRRAGDSANASTSGTPFRKTKRLPADGFPRVLISSACSGSSATLKFSHSILEAHGYDVFVGSEPVGTIIPNHRTNDFYNQAKKNLEDRFNREPTPKEITIESIRLNNEKALSENKILLIKINNIWKEGGEVLSKMGTKFAFSYRSNLIDRAICVVRDCFQNESFGHPVFLNGTRSDSCFNRRSSKEEKVLANITNTDSFINFIIKKESENRHRIRKHQSYLTPKATVQSFEKLFQFEYTDNEEILEESVKLWCKLLGNFVETIDENIVREVLRPHMNVLPPLSPHSTLIYNYDVIEETLARVTSPLLLRSYVRE